MQSILSALARSSAQYARTVTVSSRHKSLFSGLASLMPRTTPSVPSARFRAGRAARYVAMYALLPSQRFKIGLAIAEAEQI
jgi:hypothetical protein